jgi:hypothetical protein
MAQLNGENLKGDFGLSAGSQAPPGVWTGFMYYRYHIDQINDRNGTKLSLNGDTSVSAGIGLVNAVTKKKFLGANYGFLVALPVLNYQLETPHFVSNPSAGVGDIYVQPLQLGWQTKKADLIAGYGFFAPTGRYTAGAGNNTGFGMWSHELSAGTTVYFDRKKEWNAATLAALEFHTDKRGTNGTHAGSLLTLEGGMGKKFLMGGINTGLVYYAQWKLTDDRFGTVVPTLLVHGRNSSAALGPEFTMALASKKKGKVYGLATFRYYKEVYARTTTKGNSLLFSLIFPIKPLKIPPPPGP